jgi:hypothetical protein
MASFHSSRSISPDTVSVSVSAVQLVTAVASYGPHSASWTSRWYLQVAYMHMHVAMDDDHGSTTWTHRCLVKDDGYNLEVASCIQAVWYLQVANMLSQGWWYNLDAHNLHILHTHTHACASVHMQKRDWEACHLQCTGNTQYHRTRTCACTIKFLEKIHKKVRSPGSIPEKVPSPEQIHSYLTVCRMIHRNCNVFP